ncbi:MAG: cupredoxin domain-containing protein [Actinomycetota bacterium]|nr:cupredoxin domain-containing protein [Actinomycetota bacterium]
MRLIVASLAALFLLGACSNGAEPAAEPAPAAGGGGGNSSTSISAVDNEFEPTELALTAGEEVTVTFTNDGEAPHTFTSEELGFDTGTVDPGASAEVTFTAPEEETPFVCTIHAESDDMVGTIVAE